MTKNCDVLFPINETRKCDKCGAFTWWAAKRQRSKGRCFDCATIPESTPEQFDAALVSLLCEFPGATVIEARTRRFAPGYVGRDAGPCRGCGGSVRLYGEGAYPFCTTCQPEEERDGS